MDYVYVIVRLATCTELARPFIAYATHADAKVALDSMRQLNHHVVYQIEELPVICNVEGPVDIT